jgi:hypothetical protein
MRTLSFPFAPAAGERGPEGNFLQDTSADAGERGKNHEYFIISMEWKKKPRILRE